MLPRRLFPLLMLLVAAPAASQTARADTSAIRRYVTEEMRRDRIPGAAVVVVSRQGIVYAQGFGGSGRGDERVTADTPFLLGSMSKSFTALAVMQLVEAGRIALDTPVVRYLPEFRLQYRLNLQV